MARFEVLGLDGDRDLVRLLARRLAKNDAEATRLRVEVAKSIVGERPGKGGILAALRRSPLVGAGLEVRRTRTTGRPVDL
jgi:hypothetical protein